MQSWEQGQQSLSWSALGFLFLSMQELELWAGGVQTALHGPVFDDLLRRNWTL